ncbi:hypothetical protein VOLCADRAFT_120351 [Volvox carteri f. nagariensis]|uniref:Uncharacterized protein n=1 Tax=Volvox carteri f. nagariensis TaxID=3068 RepID=D8TKR9_VOLCA|nr:uncharacterized protein VOLCADRAFT_120351 [Volvox carteri f. nagariensis]EFJ52111.1 hypothetical protein VOLCADRAFT_120351 [Volvox carteri f. nagariensis]|eukprot:XP_002946885.1 hypothetical protein VOLCADRAFT_120351 [Volvox carteri f. nagariensis]
MTTGGFDCRSYDLNSYASNILKRRIERFSTVYACCFITAAEAALADGVTDAPAEGEAPTDMLLTASSTGDLRLYWLSDLVQKWTATTASGASTTTFPLQAPEAASCGSWAAHQGPVYCLAKVHTGSGLVILSGGDDGYVRGWLMSDVLRHVQAATRDPQRNTTHSSAATANETHQHQQPGLQHRHQQASELGSTAPAGPPAHLAVRMPRAESPLAASSLPPAVQALAPGRAGSGAVGVFVGCSDGGVHCLDLSSGGPVGHFSGPGHVAAVMAMDLHEPSSCLATGSEDGTVRLWDTRAAAAGGGGGAGRCARVLDGAAGRDVAGGGGGAEVLRCLRNPPVTCLRFDTSGSWLLSGQGGAAGGGGGTGAGGGSLGMWNLGMVQRVRQAPTSFVPQAMAVQPAEVLVVGSEQVLSRYSWGLEGPAQQPLTTRSAFALDVHPLTGAVAVGGVGASLELLSKYGKRTGGLAFISDED